jgi:hypothetical protein
MIDSTSHSDRTPRADNTSQTPFKVPVNRAGTDQFSAPNSALLRAALAAYPEVRPEVVARGRMLAADPGYPPPEVLRKIGAIILRAPDLSADES